MSFFTVTSPQRASGGPRAGRQRRPGACRHRIIIHFRRQGQDAAGRQAGIGDSLNEILYTNPDCNYAHPSCEVDTTLYSSALHTKAAARVIDGVHADSAQLPAKLEWVLGADLESQGDDNLEFAEQYLEDRRETTVAKRMISAGLLDYRRSNYYIANADFQLGVPHRALEAEPYRLGGMDLTPTERRSYTAELSTGSLIAAIDSAAPVIDESIPSEVRTVSLTVNGAAAAYYGVIVARLHVSSMQRPAQTKCVDGMHTLKQGDDQLDHAAAISSVPLSATARHEITSAFTTLRRASSRISQADAMLSIHHLEPTVTLPIKISGFNGLS